MKNIKKYNEYINEEITLKQGLIGAGIGAAVIGSSYYTMKNNGKAELTDIIEINNNKFKEYSLITTFNNFKLKINEGIIVSEHNYDKGSGDNKKTINITNLIIPYGIDKIWYYYSLIDGVCATSKEFNKSKLIDIDDLKVYKQTSTYTIYKGGMLSPFDYIIVVGNHKGDKNSIDCELLDSGQVYNCDKINDDIYIFNYVRSSSGDFGGGGSGNEF